MEQKPCPLGIEEWLDFLETMLSIKHSNYPMLMNILVAFATVGTVISISYSVSLYGKIPMIIYIVDILIVVLIIIAVLAYMVRNINKEIKKNRREYEAIYEIIKKIINGELTDSNSIRKAWYEANIP